jgi:hypothetical protein
LGEKAGHNILDIKANSKFLFHFFLNYFLRAEVGLALPETSVRSLR